jgi:hypothetical protein
MVNRMIPRILSRGRLCAGNSIRMSSMMPVHAMIGRTNDPSGGSCGTPCCAPERAEVNQRRGKERTHGPLTVCQPGEFDAEGQEICARIRRDRNSTMF